MSKILKIYKNLLIDVVVVKIVAYNIGLMLQINAALWR